MGKQEGDYKYWAKVSGLAEVTLRRRIADGMTMEQAIAKGKGRESWAETITYNGVTDTFKGWSERTGIPERTLRVRLSTRDSARTNSDTVWTVEKALTTPVKHSTWNDKQIQMKAMGVGKQSTAKKLLTTMDEANEILNILNKS